MNVISVVGVAMGVVLALPYPQEVVLTAKRYLKDQPGLNLACGFQVTG